MCNNTTYFSHEKAMRISRLEQKPYPLWSSACWSRAFGGTWRTIDVISRGALKSRQQAWHLYLQGTWSYSSKNKSLQRKCVLNIPFFLVSWVELSSQWRSPNPVADQAHQNQMWKAEIIYTVYNVDLSWHDTERGSTYKRVIRFVIADIWQDGGGLIYRR